MISSGRTGRMMPSPIVSTSTVMKMKRTAPLPDVTRVIARSVSTAPGRPDHEDLSLRSIRDVDDFIAGDDGVPGSLGGGARRDPLERPVFVQPRDRERRRAGGCHVERAPFRQVIDIVHAVARLELREDSPVREGGPELDMVGTGDHEQLATGLDGKPSGAGLAAGGPPGRGDLARRCLDPERPVLVLEVRIEEPVTVIDGEAFRIAV